MFAAFCFILGICVGSFINVCVDRLPQGQSLLSPPSHCPSCGQRIRWYDLMPVLSYILLKGKCRYCRQGIPSRILLIEVGAGVIFLFLGLAYGDGISFYFAAFYLCLFLIIAIIDLEHGLIPNRIVYPAVIVSLLLAPFWAKTDFSRSFIGHDGMLATFLSSLIGGSIFFALFLLIALIYRGSIGGGDIKMAGLIGMAVGMANVPVALLVSVMSGGLIAGMLLLLKIKRRKETIPFGPFLSLGAVAALIWGTDLVNWYQRLSGIN